MELFTVPADFKAKSLNQYAEMNSQSTICNVYETYGQITSNNPYGSGRSKNILPDINLRTLERYVLQSKDLGISFAYTLNAICLGNQEFSSVESNKLKQFCSNLYNIGVETIIVAMPSLIELIKYTIPKMKIKASVICQINGIYKAQFYSELGVDSVVIDMDCIRNFKTIKQISEIFPCQTEIIVNNTCRLYCPYKIFHYCHESHSKKRHNAIDDYYFNRCNITRNQSKESYLQMSWVRPEDINYYTECGVNIFKIQGRQDVQNGDIHKTVQHYFNHSFDGNLVDLLMNFRPYNSFMPYIDNRSLDGFINAFYNGTVQCTQDCKKCGYCLRFAEKSARGDIEAINRLAKRYFKEDDAYNKMVKEIKE